jgi:hypothetical protein
MKKLFAFLVVLLVACGGDPVSQRLSLATDCSTSGSGGEAGATSEAGMSGAPLPEMAAVLNFGESNESSYAFGTPPAPPANVQYVEYVTPTTRNTNNGIIGPLAPRVPTGFFGPSLYTGITLSPLYQNVAMAQAEVDSIYATNWEPPPAGIGVWTSDLLPAINALKSMAPNATKVVVFASVGDREIQGGPSPLSFQNAYKRLLTAIRAQFPGRTVYFVVDLVNINYRTTISQSITLFDGILAAQQAIASDPTLAPITSISYDDMNPVAANGNPHYQPPQQVERGKRRAALASQLLQ